MALPAQPDVLRMRTVSTARTARVARGARAVMVAVSLSAVAGLIVSVLPMGAAYASPRLTLTQAQAKLADLQNRAELATETYNQARIAVAAARRNAASAAADVTRQKGNVSREQRALAALAASSYRTGGTDELVTLVTTKDPQVFVDQSTFLDQFARGRSASLLSMKTARKRLSALQQSAKDQVDAAANLERQAEQNKARVDTLIAEQGQVISGLRAEDRARYLALQNAAAARAAQQRVSGASYGGSASGRALSALQEAYRQMGKPYVYGAAGPDAFDCSGLTEWAFAHAGVSLPHSAAAQYNYGMHVSYSELQPGDLVFFSEGGYIGHVGIYVGNGNMIDAPHSGSYVGVRGLYPGFVGGTRL